MELPLHASPAFIAARKGHLTGRMVVDFRFYNTQIQVPCFSMPDSDNILSDLTDGDVAYFGASDLATGYFHAELSEEEIPYLAITTPDGVYFSKKLQLGPSWAPAWFQSRSRAAFSQEFHVYIDDILFKSKDAYDLLRLIKEMHQGSNRTGFVLSLKKTYLGVTSVDALGHTVTTDGRCCAQGKIDLIDNWGLPDSVQNLKSLVCVMVYLREYIWRFSEKVFPLKKYLRGKNPTPFSEFKGDKLAHRAIELLKKSIATKATIKHIDRVAASNYEVTDRPAIAYVDASNYGESFVICQKPDKKRPPQIAVYKARSFGDTERSWSTLERELHAMTWFAEHGARYIEGIPCILMMDHKNLGEQELQSIWVNKQKSEKITRWCERVIGAFGKMQIRRHYLPGQLNILADVGSRFGHDTTKNYEMPRSVRELVKSLFNTTSKDLKTIDELVELAEEEKEKDQFAALSQRLNSITEPIERLAAIALLSKAAEKKHQASKKKKEPKKTKTDNEEEKARLKLKERKEEAKLLDPSEDFEFEDAEIFDDQSKNKSTARAARVANKLLDVSEWKDDKHYTEEEEAFDGEIGALKENQKIEMKFKIGKSETDRGDNVTGTITAPELPNLKDNTGKLVDSITIYETYEKATKHTKLSQAEAKKKKLDQKWVVGWKIDDDSKKHLFPKKGFEWKLIPQAEATKADREKAIKFATERVRRRLREEMLEHCPEPDKGEWRVLDNFDTTSMGQRTIDNWRHNHALGPIHKLNPKHDWEETATEYVKPGHRYKVYKLKNPGSNIENFVMGGEDEVDLPASENEIFNEDYGDDALDPMEVDQETPKNSKNWLQEKIERLQREKEEEVDEESLFDFPILDDDEDQKIDIKMHVKEEKLLTPTEAIKSPIKPNQQEDKRTMSLETQVAENHILLENEKEWRQETQGRYDRLKAIISENYGTENRVWSRTAEYEEWQEQIDFVFNQIPHVYQNEQYDQVEFYDGLVEYDTKIVMEPRRVYKVMLLTTSEGVATIFPAMATHHFQPTGHLLDPNLFIETVNLQPESRRHKLVGTIVFSRPTQAVDLEDFFSTEELENLREAQTQCRETKYKILYLNKDEETRDEWLKKRLPRSTARVEELDLSTHRFELRNDLLYMNGRLVIPRVLTKAVITEDSDRHSTGDFKYLRTYIIDRAHKQGHDFQLAHQRITDDWKVVWPRMEKDLIYYKANCLHCIVESTVPTYTDSYKSETYGTRNHAWFIDHQGPFGPSGDKDRFYLLTCIDDASGRIWIRKVKDKEVATVIVILEKLFDECNPNRIPPEVSIFGADASIPPVPLRVRADNGFGREVTRFCKEYAKKHNMCYTPAFIEGTAENPSGQHRIERPHKSLRGWINQQNADNNEQYWRQPGLALELEKRWNVRRQYGLYSPNEAYYGREPNFVCGIHAANEFRNNSRRQILAELTALRNASAQAAQRQYFKHHGLSQQALADGDLVVLAHLSAKRKSKKSFLSNYRYQIFKVHRNVHERDSKYNRVFLTGAIGDSSIRFKQPINVKKLKKIPARFGKYVTFEDEVLPSENYNI